MEIYKPWDFCRSINCNTLIRTEPQREQLCKDCKAYQMHDYLRGHEQIAEEGNSLLTELEQYKRALDMCLERWQHAHRPGFDPKYKESQMATMKDYLLTQAKEVFK